MVLQLDCPDLACVWADEPEHDAEEFRGGSPCASRRSTTPPGTSRPTGSACTCAGATARGRTTPTFRWPTSSTWCWPPGPAAISFEAANPRHEHEWKVFEDVKLPEGKVIIPGVLDSTTNFIEHPELVAQRLVRYANVVGRAERHGR